MHKRRSTPFGGKIDELPDRIEHRRKVAKRIALDTREHEADDPTRSASYRSAGYRIVGPDRTESGRGPHV